MAPVPPPPPPPVLGADGVSLPDSQGSRPRGLRLGAQRSEQTLAEDHTGDTRCRGGENLASGHWPMLMKKPPRHEGRDGQVRFPRALLDSLGGVGGLGGVRFGFHW